MACLINFSRTGAVTGSARHVLLKDSLIERVFAVQSLIKQMSAEGAPASRMSVDSGQFIFHYIIEGGVCYLTLTGSILSKSTRNETVIIWSHGCLSEIQMTSNVVCHMWSSKWLHCLSGLFTRALFLQHYCLKASEALKLAKNTSYDDHLFGLLSSIQIARRM